MNEEDRSESGDSREDPGVESPGEGPAGDCTVAEAVAPKGGACGDERYRLRAPTFCPGTWEFWASYELIMGFLGSNRINLTVAHSQARFMREGDMVFLRPNLEPGDVKRWATLRETNAPQKWSVVKVDIGDASRFSIITLGHVY